ncbi:MAG: thiol reductant ABC exporter subunit CydC [Chloroflexota bacterium]
MSSDSPLNTLRRLSSYLLPFWRSIALSVLLGVLTIASSVGLMATSAWMISKAGLQPSIAELGVSVVSVRFFGIARGVFRYLERLVSHDTTFRLLADWRVRFYQAIEPLAPAHLTDLRSGDLLSRVVSDIESLQEVYLRAIAPPLVAMITAVLVTLFFWAFDPLIALIMVAFLIIGGVGVPWLAWWIGQHPGRDLVANRSELNAALVDSIQGMADSLVYGQGKSQLAHLNQLNNRFATYERQIAGLDGLQTAFGVVVLNGAALMVLAVAIPRVDGIYLATLALATVAAFEAITPLAQAATNLGTGLAAAQEIFEVIDTPPAVLDLAQSSPTPQDYRLEFDHVSFRYTPETPLVFKDFSFSLKDGQHIALLGASGSGKSTLVNLLLRFWEYESGTIRLGDYDLRDYAPADLRQMIGVMSQRTYLFNTTIMENIRLARINASDANVFAAAQQAQIHDFVLTLPAGYQTTVGEDGAKLSGGERQRIALARVLLKNAPLVILDEPTANLDATTERAIWQTILDSMTNQTVLILTHRPLFLERLDGIVKLK